MNSLSHVPPGFRFHPTDEELIDYYLRKKINSRRIDLDVIKDVDLYKIEPWDLQEMCQTGSEDENEWYFFSHKDKKYPTGTRTNRATAAGFWKATGRDKSIYSKHELIGMRKTLVFYKGRAPNGHKSDWIMHEYRLESDELGTTQEEGWVVCRVFKKRTTTIRRVSEHESSSSWYDDQVSFMNEEDSPNQNSNPQNLGYHHLSYSCRKEINLQCDHQLPYDQHFHLPLLRSPKLLLQPITTCTSVIGCTSISAYGLDINQVQSSNSLATAQDQRLLPCIYGNEKTGDDEVTTDWRVLDELVASQLSQEELPKRSDRYLIKRDTELEIEKASSSSTSAASQINILN